MEATVPVLWDKTTGTLVNNESADILRMLGTVFAPLAKHPVELYPERLQGDIDELNKLIYENVNNAVYRAGFATKPGGLRAATSRPCSRRSTSSICGWPSAASCSDPTRWRPTGGCSPRCCASTPSTRSTSSARSASWSSTSSLWPYARDLYQWPGVAETVSFDEIRAHYYRTHPMINPSGIMAMLPAASFEESTTRASLR